MKCPRCKKDIDHVTITCLAYQRGTFFQNTNEIVSYDSVEMNEFNHKAYCPKCDRNITSSVKET